MRIHCNLQPSPPTKKCRQSTTFCVTPTNRIFDNKVSRVYLDWFPLLTSFPVYYGMCCNVCRRKYERVTVCRLESVRVSIYHFLA